jgi:hypothetical protein
VRKLAPSPKPQAPSDGWRTAPAAVVIGSRDQTYQAIARAPVRLGLGWIAASARTSAALLRPWRAINFQARRISAGPARVGLLGLAGYNAARARCSEAAPS